MRLSAAEQALLVKAVQAHSQGLPFRLFLFGSRVHDHLKGGDIDLLILAHEQAIPHFKSKDLDLRVTMKSPKALGARRIDIKYATSSELLTDPFLKLIAEEMVEITAQS